jgi:hypothetical protein
MESPAAFPEASRGMTAWAVPEDMAAWAVPEDMAASAAQADMVAWAVPEDMVASAAPADMAAWAARADMVAWAALEGTAVWAVREDMEVLVALVDGNVAAYAPAVSIGAACSLCPYLYSGQAFSASNRAESSLDCILVMDDLSHSI